MAQNIIFMGKVKREDLFRQIIQALNSMPEPLREIFTRAHYRGEDISAIASRFGRSEEEIWRLLKQADQDFHSTLERNDTIHCTSRCSFKSR